MPFPSLPVSGENNWDTPLDASVLYLANRTYLYRGVFSTSANYDIGDVVTNGNYTYQALVTVVFGSAFNPTNWTRIGPNPDQTVSTTSDPTFNSVYVSSAVHFPDGSSQTTAAPVTSVAGRTGAVTLSAIDITNSTSVGRNVLTASSQAAGQVALGLGSAATQATSAFDAAGQAAAEQTRAIAAEALLVSKANNLSDIASPSAARTNLAAAADSSVVHNTGAETVAGVKTFSSSPIVPDGSFAETAVTNLVTDLAAKAVDNTVVHLAGAESISGVKTFTSAPILPAASLPESAVTGLTSDLAAKAPLASPTFTGTVTVPSPVNATDVSTKAYVDSVAVGLSVKDSIKVATTTALPANTYSSGVITVTATGTLTIDGQLVALNDRVLVHNEVTQANNGIYLCTTAGATGVSAVLTRATDSNTGTLILHEFTFVSSGTINANNGFVNTNTSAPVLGTTPITYSQFSGAGQIIAGEGITKSGNTLSLTVPVSVADGGTGSVSQNFVDLTTAQSVAGVKTFASAPIVPAASFPETAVANLTSDLASKLTASNSLSDVTSAAAARTNLAVVHRGDFAINVKDYGALGDGTTDDTTAIQNALNASPAGGKVFLPQGNYRTSAPLILPPNVTIEGTHGNHLDDVAQGYLQNNTYIQPLSSFSGAACLYMVDKEIGGYSADNAGQRIYHLTLDGAALTGTTIDGIQANGKVHGVIIENVAIRNFPNHGITTKSYTRLDATSVNPFSWRIRRVIADTCGGYHFSFVSLTDSTLIDIESIGSGKSGFYINNCGNSHFIACRSEWSAQHGFEIHAGGNFGGCQFTSLSTDRNTMNGVYVTDAGGSQPILFNGLTLRRDGRNGGTGGNSYAGFFATGVASPIIVSSLVVVPGVDDDGTVTNSPQYGLSVASCSYVSVDSGFLHGNTAGWHDAGGNTTLRRGPNIGERTGLWNAGTLALQNNWGTDNGSTFTAALNVADATAITLSNTATNVNNALMQYTTGGSGDSLIKAKVSGDANNRFIQTINNGMSFGSGSAPVDTNLYRSGVGILQTDNSLQVTGGLGLSQTPPSAGIGVTLSAVDGIGLTLQNSAANSSQPLLKLQTGSAGSDNAIKTFVSGDTNSRLIVAANGQHTWGSGSATGDTTLYRSAVGSLRTDTALLGQSVTATGFSGSTTAASRYVGGTVSGAPTSGTFVAGDFVIDQTGKVQVCTVGGTPGTWASLAQVNPATSSTLGTVELTGDLAGTATAPQVVSTHLASALPIAQGGTGSVTQNFVDLTAAQTVAGVKTFSSAPVVPAAAFPESAVANLTSDLASKAVDSTVVHLSGTETITGAKTFSIAPVVPSNSFAESAVTNLVSDLAAKAPLASPTFSGTVTIPTPVNATDASTKAYVDGVAAGLSVKASVQEATAAALPANTYLAGVITLVTPGVLTVDGQTVALNDRVLVQNEVTQANNGIYLCTTAGAVGVAAVLTRAQDSNTGAEILGAFVFVEKGTANADSGFVNTNTSVPTLGTTAITYTQFSGAGEITAGTGLTKTGNTIALTTPVSVANGGTGSATQNFVDLTTAQTVAGVKTFSSAPVVPAASFPESAITNLTTDLAAKLTAASNLSDVVSASTSLSNLGGATNTLVVHLAGTETITGAKTFSVAPVVPASSFPESAVTNLTTDLASKLTASNNLSDVTTPATALANIGGTTVGVAAALAIVFGG